LRHPITAAAVGLLIACGQTSFAIDASASPTVRIKYLSRGSELDSLELGAHFISDLPVAFSNKGRVDQ
jgi:hypothetical protein